MQPRRQPVVTTAAVRGGSAVARLARAIALLLFGWQALVVPAHRHVASAPTVASAKVSVAPLRHRPDQPADCPVCREVAHGGQYLSPADARLTAPVAVAFQPAAATLALLRGEGRSHAWRSRAPPVLGLT